MIRRITIVAWTAIGLALIAIPILTAGPLVKEREQVRAAEDASQA